MPWFLDLFGKGAKTVPSQGQPQQRLTPQQRKVIDALRRMGEATRPKRIKLLKDYAEKLKAEGPKVPAPPPEKARLRPQFTIPASLPISVPEDVQDFLKRLADDQDAKALRLEGAGALGGKVVYLTSGEEKKQVGTFRHSAEKLQEGTRPGFGISLELKGEGGEEDRLEVVIRYGCGSFPVGDM